LQKFNLSVTLACHCKILSCSSFWADKQYKLLPLKNREILGDTSLEKKILDIIGADEPTLDVLRSFWKENHFSLNIPVIDLQHIWLIFLINSLEKQTDYGSMDGIKKIISILHELINFTTEHFTLEEKLLLKFDYPEIIEHEKQHQIFIEELREADLFVHKPNFTVQPIVNFLREWLSKHILKEDKKYQDFFIEKSIDLKPFFKQLISSKGITIDKPQSVLFSSITGTNEVKQIINTNVIQNVIHIWQANNLSVNVPIIDLQHLWLIKMIVELELTVKTSESAKRKEVFQETIKGTFQYARDHFALEEMIMQKFHYPKYSSHIKQHLWFVEKINQRREESLQGDTSATYNLIHDLKSWLLSHIAIEDRNIGIILKERLNDITLYVRELVEENKAVVSKNQLALYSRVMGLAIR
jgi:hemerythrin-like metal-binding protein